MTELTGSAAIVLAHSTHPRIDRFPAIGVFQGNFSEEEKNVAIAFDGAHECRLIQLLEIELLGSLVLAIDEGVASGEISYRR